MEQFNVINYNCNAKQFERYDVIPHLVDEYNSLKKDKVRRKYKPLPVTFEEFKKFVKDESHYQWWGRCEYEIILVDWPCQCHEEKWDVHQQVMMNLDHITELVMKSVKVK